MVNFKTSPTDSWTEQRHMEWKSAQKKSKLVTNNTNIISFTVRFKLYRSLVTYFLLYGCETSTLLADSKKRSRLSKPSA